MGERRSPPSVASSSNRPNSTPQGNPLEYLRAVKAELDEDSAEYLNFLEIMKDVKNEAYSTGEVVWRVKKLFRSHPNLILGFNQFLPPNYHITSTPENPVINFDLAMGFVTKVKDRFIDDPHVYRNFLGSLSRYNNGLKDGVGPTDNVIREMQQLFQNDPDLLDEFYQFAPITADGNAGSTPEPASLPPEQAENEPNGNAGSTPEPASRTPETNGNTHYPHFQSHNPGEPVAELLEKAKERLETEACEDILKCLFSYSEGAMIVKRRRKKENKIHQN